MERPYQKFELVGSIVQLAASVATSQTAWLWTNPKPYLAYVPMASIPKSRNSMISSTSFYTCKQLKTSIACS